MVLFVYNIISKLFKKLTYSLTYKNKAVNWYRVVLVVLIAIYLFYYARNLNEWHFIDNVNLIFHEAGHVVFGFMGEFVKVLGGTLMQLLIPGVCFMYFYRKGDMFSSSLILFWLGQNFLNVSVYASDALKMELPLLGGDSVGHDWNYILSNMHLTRFTDQIGSAIYFIGIITIVFAIFLAIKYSIKTNYKITL